MVIRSEQIDVYGDQMLRNFIERMLAYVRSRFTSQTANVSDADLRETVRAGIAQAETYNVTDEADVRRYLEFVMSYGSNFDSAEWAARVLNHGGSGTAKMNELDDVNICRVSGGGK